MTDGSSASSSASRIQTACSVPSSEDEGVSVGTATADSRKDRILTLRATRLTRSVTPVGNDAVPEPAPLPLTGKASERPVRRTAAVSSSMLQALEVLERLAQAEDRLLRPQVPLEIVTRRIADRAEQHRVGSLGDLERLGR